MYFLQKNPTWVRFPNKTVEVLFKDDSDAEPRPVALEALIKERCPTFFKDFKPAWWLFNGLDFTPVDTTDLPDETPIVVVLPGLTGGSTDSYIRTILAPICVPRARGGPGFRGVVVNHRGCAGVPVTSQRLYTPGGTDDLRQALMYIAHKFPNAPLLGLGFSLGSNKLTRYLAEEGENSRFVAACALACPWDLAQNNMALEDSILGKHIYSKSLGSSLAAVVTRNAAALTADPDHPLARLVPEVFKLKSPTMPEYDGAFAMHIGGTGPPWPFPNVEEFYTYFSSINTLPDIRVPFVAINAADDPVVRRIPASGGSNGLVTMVITRAGGHLGWFEAGKGEKWLGRWIQEPVLQWLILMGRNVVHKTRGSTLYVNDAGFLKEVGMNNDLGCKEILRGGVFDGSIAIS
ncbi:AB-hydrolase YheT [Fistulina hepatica ATCC 64428]|uniref:AB-hydrolase YheT n=1 Tax=Fistulina hepatica ATCC 64428 TaxID=1128425 RepID=A0A0D7AGZ6_9AGAR|nr:AB-hydrolase YheT [Fistulina hepatica ATCC 64428]